MTLRYPPARWDPLGPQTEAAMLGHDILCAHTMVGSLAGTNSMFHANGYGGTESHFGFGENAAQGIKQWQDLMFEADANLEGHTRVVSFETADYGGSFGTWNTSSDANVPAWNLWQLDAIVDLVVWFCRKSTHAGCPATWACHKAGVPCVLIPDTKPGRRGLGYHKQGCDPWRVAGGEKWSTAYGKGCPGNRRISQFINIVIPRAQKILAGGPAPEYDVPLSPEDLAAIDRIVDTSNSDYAVRFWTLPTGTGTALINTVNGIASALAALALQVRNEDQADDAALVTAVTGLNDQLAALQASVDALAAGEVPGTPTEPPKA